MVCRRSVVSGTCLKKNSGAKITYQKVGTYIRLKHNAALYSSKGKKTEAKSYKKGQYTKIVGIRIIKGKRSIFTAQLLSSKARSTMR